MAQDETEFDRLLRETREWEARDRARHPAFGMKDDAGGDAFPPASRVPTATIGELEKKAAADVASKPPPKAQAASSQAPNAAAPHSGDVTWGDLKAAMKQARAQAKAQSQTTRVRRKGGWGWVWVLILLYFLFRHFVR
jgi:hypothetical protein